MAKVRVYQLAKELQVQSALILELLDRMGREVKSDLSTLDTDTVDVVRERVTVAIEAEKKRIVEQRAREAALAETEMVPSEVAETGEGPAPVSEAPPVEPEPARPAAAKAPAAPVAAKVAAAKRTRFKPGRKESPAAAAAAAGAITPSTARKPRVFPARRIPSPSVLARPKPGAAGPGARPAPGRGPTPPPTPPGGAGSNFTRSLPWRTSTTAGPGWRPGAASTACRCRSSSSSRS